MPIYAALQSIANETYRTRLFTEIQTQIIAEKEGLFNTPRLRRRVSSAPIIDEEPIDETDDIDQENSNDTIITINGKNQNLNFQDLKMLKVAKRD